MYILINDQCHDDVSVIPCIIVSVVSNYKEPLFLNAQTP